MPLTALSNFRQYSPLIARWLHMRTLVRFPVPSMPEITCFMLCGCYQRVGHITPCSAHRS